MYASVAIDLALDRLFAYSVPPELEDRIAIGQLLRVPFRARTARGFVLALHDAPPGGLDPRKIRPVATVEDDAPFFSAAMLKLVRWMAGYTATPVETALRAAVPAAVLKKNARPRELLFVSPASGRGLPPEDGLTPRRKTLLGDVRRTGGGWLQALCKEFSASPEIFKALAKAGFLRIEPRERRRDPLQGRNIMHTAPLPLNAEQAAAIDAIRREKRPVLLFGVTGSGKTEVYLQAIAAELAAGRGAIVMVPEIALTPQTVRRFAGRFGENVAVLHSALSDGERYDEWQRIRRGAARVVVGPRSAVFAPVANLGLIVVDEEHDSSYKQDEMPRYNGRDTAVMRAALEGASVVLGSATPSLESWANAQSGKYALVRMANRVNGNPMPPVSIVDMAAEARESGFAPVFSQRLLDAISARLNAGEQTILLLNRRGYSRSLQCPACGRVEKCEACDMAYTYHKADDCLRCHICGGWKRTPQTCPDCGAPRLRKTGIGTQRAEAALHAIFRHARILRMDADAVSRGRSHDDILSDFRAGRADILIGTQMIAKGLDFPNVTLVGVLNADTSLHMPDPRAAERTFQLLAQVAGRAGRADLPGEVFVQTFSPDEPSVKAVAAGCDFESFAAGEMEARREAEFPPYLRMSAVLVRSESEEKASAWASMYSKAMAAFAARPGTPRMLVSAAEPAALARAEGFFRFQILVRAKRNADVAAAWRWIRGERPPPPDVRISLDIDALNLM